MKAADKNYFYSILISCFFILLTTFSYGAVFQEPVADSPNTFTTRYLFSGEGITPYETPAPLPGLSEEKPAAVTDEIIDQTSPSATTISTGEDLPRIEASYTRSTLSSVQKIMDKYKSIPGGVTLEGTARGLEKIEKVVFDKDTNTFILNEDLLYANPVSISEMKEIVRSLISDDRIGVSLGSSDLIYGSLRNGTFPCINLKLADHFLGCIVFANNRWISRYRFPENYKPKKNRSSGGSLAVYFNFDNYRFLTVDNTIIPDASAFTITLIPLTNQKVADGGYMPDFDKVEKGVFPQEFEQNASHIARNIDYYRHDSRLKNVIAYGEAAAFVRSLKENGIDLNEVLEKS